MQRLGERKLGTHVCAERVLLREQSVSSHVSQLGTHGCAKWAPMCVPAGRPCVHCMGTPKINCAALCGQVGHSCINYLGAPVQMIGCSCITSRGDRARTARVLRREQKGDSGVTALGARVWFCWVLVHLSGTHA